MNGSENAYAGALFLALISLGAVLKIDDIMIGGGVGAACALLAAIFFRIALNKSAQAAEEDHQRMEVQFQQLRTKIIEATESSTNAANFLGEVSQLLQKNLQLMNDKQTELNNLTKLTKNVELINLTLTDMNNKQTGLDNFAELAKNVESINLSLVGLEENSFAVNTGLEKISVAIQSQEKSSDSEEFKKLLEIEDVNKANLQTALKILHVIAQIVRNSNFDKELEKINSTLERLINQNKILGEIKVSTDSAQKNLSEMVKISGNLSRNFTTTLDDLRVDMVKLSAKLEELNDRMNKSKAALIEETPSKKSRRR